MFHLILIQPLLFSLIISLCPTSALQIGQSTASHAPKTWFVDSSNCPGPGTGTAADPFCEIHQAVSAVQTGDTVLVRPGTYQRFNFPSKNIVIRSDVDGAPQTHDPAPSITIIDGAGVGPVVAFGSGSTRDAILEGFMIIDGSSITGGGIRCAVSAPSILGNVISNCTATSRGGGIYSAAASPRIEGNHIESNTAQQGGGVYVEFGSPTELRSNTIRNNAATRGGGLYVLSNNGAIVANTISLNSAPDGGGGLWVENAAPPITENLIAGNLVGHYGGGGLATNGGAFPVVKNNLVLYNRAFGMFGFGGGALVNSGGSNFVKFFNNTFVGNEGNFGGAFLLSSSSKVEFRNGILWENDLPPVSWTPRMARCARMSICRNGSDGSTRLKRRRTQSAWCARSGTSRRSRETST